MAKISNTQPQRSRLCFRVIGAGWYDAMHLKKYKLEAQASEYAIMLPVATGPNAIVFGSNQIIVREMARKGLVLCLS
jgi:di/tricarboxylate transporter